MAKRPISKTKKKDTSEFGTRPAGVPGGLKTHTFEREKIIPDYYTRTAPIYSTYLLHTGSTHIHIYYIQAVHTHMYYANGETVMLSIMYVECQKRPIRVSKEAY